MMDHLSEKAGVRGLNELFVLKDIWLFSAGHPDAFVSLRGVTRDDWEINIIAIVRTSVLEARDQSRAEDDVHIDVVLVGFAPEGCNIFAHYPCMDVSNVKSSNCGIAWNPCSCSRWTTPQYVL
jgi:hypothetical protein